MYKQNQVDKKDTKSSSNHTNISLPIKSQLENSSGISLDNVRVNYNSSLPQSVGALAMTKGTKIDIAPNQEKHLKHEIGHAIDYLSGGSQQETLQYFGIPIDSSQESEKRADDYANGKKAVLLKNPNKQPVTLRMVGMEFQTFGGKKNVYEDNAQGIVNAPHHGLEIASVIIDATSNLVIKVETDGYDLEYITTATNNKEGQEVQVRAIPLIHEHIINGRPSGRMGIYNFIWLGNGQPTWPPIPSYLPRTCSKFDATQPIPSTIWIDKEGNTKAHPQATIGLTMDEIYGYLDNMGNDRRFGNTTLELNANDMALYQQLAIQYAVNAVRDDNTLDIKAKGFVALIEHYINCTAANLMGVRSNYTGYFMNMKNAMPLMARTSLTDLYNLLTVPEKRACQTWLTTHHNANQTVFGMAGDSVITLETVLDALTRGTYGYAYGSFSELQGSNVNLKYRMSDATDIDRDMVRGRKGGLFELRSMKYGMDLKKVGDLQSSIDEVYDKSRTAGTMKRRKRSANTIYDALFTKNVITQTKASDLLVAVYFRKVIAKPPSTNEQDMKDSCQECNRKFRRDYAVLGVTVNEIVRIIRVHRGDEKAKSSMFL